MDTNFGNLLSRLRRSKSSHLVNSDFFYTVHLEIVLQPSRDSCNHKFELTTQGIGKFLLSSGFSLEKPRVRSIIRQEIIKDVCEGMADRSAISRHSWPVIAKLDEVKI